MNDIKWNNQEVVDALIKQYNLELLAMNNYYNLATKAQELGWEKLAKFFITMAQDKHNAHLLRFMDFFIQNNLVLKTLEIALPKPLKEDISATELVESALSIESVIRKHCTEVTKKAFQLGDLEIFKRMQWFVKDAVKDYEDVADVYTYITAPNTNMLTIELRIDNKLNEEDKTLYEK